MRRYLPGIFVIPAVLVYGAYKLIAEGGKLISSVLSFTFFGSKKPADGWKEFKSGMKKAFAGKGGGGGHGGGHGHGGHH